ncbi:MAG: alpha-hydroxy-acid oxidizing protein [Deltaproteobacteria bacterium]|nr:alpha-hydroxy-acid oxidizing protein [Deltaproteobacteria bacterium]
MKKINLQARPCPSRFKNPLGLFMVRRDRSRCVQCLTCVEACPTGVFRDEGGYPQMPLEHLCLGPDCAGSPESCVNRCPQGALAVSPHPASKILGDKRWPAHLLVGTYLMAETGQGRVPQIKDWRGDSGGGFDKLRLKLPPGLPSLDPEEVDTSLVINRSGDDRPEMTLGVPWYGGGMSFGSISLNTMLARARALAAFDSLTCTGEGGFPDELVPYAQNVITQVATGLFGVREETIQQVPMIEFKYAQGAKPGLGGHLLGDKVTPAVARMREAVAGSALFSPFPFHSVYSVEDHKKHVDWIKEINPRALISVKVSTPTDVDMVAVGSFYAGAHVIHIDGSYGGTGAAPDIAKKNIAMPLEYAIPKVHRFLQEEGVRDRITLIASGGVRTAVDMAKALALGADGVVIGTADLVALECIRCRHCESGRGCVRGIATTDPGLSVMFDLDWATQRIFNLYAAWQEQLQHILARLGLSSAAQLTGRSDLLAHEDYWPQDKPLPDETLWPDQEVAS